MIEGIGTDIVKIQRVKDRVIDRILSDNEKKIFNNFKNENRKKEFAAGRFSAKEALYKALNTSFDFNKVSILNKKNGEPYIDENSMNYITKKIDKIKIKVTISHEKEYAIAFVVVEREVE